jgi:hypothetical protein
LISTGIDSLSKASGLKNTARIKAVGFCVGLEAGLCDHLVLIQARKQHDMWWPIDAAVGRKQNEPYKL